MHYELCDAKSANVMAIIRTEAEGLAIVRRLLADGWNAEYLSLGIDFDEGEEGDDAWLPPDRYGASLARRASDPSDEGVPHRA